MCLECKTGWWGDVIGGSCVLDVRQDGGEMWLEEYES